MAGGKAQAEMLTRREALKRGLVLGGAVLWTTPAVQAIGMSRAAAQETSSTCTTYCVKFEFTGGDDSLDGEWVPLGADNPGNIFACPPDSDNGPFPPGFFDDFEIVSGDRKGAVVVRMPPSCTLTETAESSPDELAFGNVAAKCGSTGENVQSLSVDPVTGEFTVESCGGSGSRSPAISHIEIMVRCCP